MPYKYKNSQKKYYEVNREKILLWQKNFQERHKEEVKEYKKKYYEEHRMEKKIYYDTHIHRCWAVGCLSNHRRMGFTSKITVDELENLAKNTIYCIYCNKKFTWGKNKKTGANSPTLDRINNELELRLDNVEIICHECNTTKGRRTKKEFIAYCEHIFRVFKGVKNV